jgi:hypothetical protein
MWHFKPNKLEGANIFGHENTHIQAASKLEPVEEDWKTHFLR